MTNSSLQKLSLSAVGPPNCDKKPIYIIGQTQSHGVLIACDIDNKIITHVSNNTEALFNQEAATLLNYPIYSIIAGGVVRELLTQLQTNRVAHKEITLNKQKIAILAHRNSDFLILEFEINTTPIDPVAYQLHLAETASEINCISGVLKKCEYTASQIKKHLGYDRVVIIKFDEQWNCDVITEQREVSLESWIGMRFPTHLYSSEQARNLLLNQGVSIVGDVGSKTIGLLSSLDKSLSLEHSGLEAATPATLEFLKNINTNATLSVAIEHDGVLWGLIRCHHYSPKVINFNQRFSSGFIAKILASSIHLDNTNNVLEQTKKHAYIRSNLNDQVNRERDIARGLSTFEYTINDLTNSHGSAIYIDNKLTTVGNCPGDTEIIGLIEKIKTLTDTQLYLTQCLSNDFAEAEAYKALASGVLCLFLSPKNNDAVLWFKPEVIKMINWSGIPRKSIAPDKIHSISPNKIFAQQSIEQRGKSEHWEDYEVSEGVTLQEDIQDIIAASYDRKIATTDILTRLGNRYAFQESLEKHIRQLHTSQSFNLLFIDLDGFKAVNDAYGHLVGDKLLAETARRISSKTGLTSFVARLGGDEFAIIRPASALPEVRQFAQDLLQDIAKPYPLVKNAQESYISASIGIVDVKPKDISYVDTLLPERVTEISIGLLRDADAAMYHAKDVGKNTYRFYTGSINEEAIKTKMLNDALHRALEQDEFRLHYQPQWNINTGKLYGYEALIRWRQDSQEVSPSLFMPLVESNGMMSQLGKWVFEKALSDHAKLTRYSKILPQLSINFSPIQFRDHQLCQFIKDSLEKFDISVQSITIEITESLLISDQIQVKNQLEALKAMGLKIALDDFGTGYSSLSNLHTFPIDIIKVDKSFTDNLDVHETRQIVKAIIRMSNELNKTILFEGVETKQQLDFLHDEGVDLIQGWLISKAVSLENLAKFIAQKKQSPPPQQISIKF